MPFRPWMTLGLAGLVAVGPPAAVGQEKQPAPQPTQAANVDSAAVRGPSGSAPSDPDHPVPAVPAKKIYLVPAGT
jgi:hypothetical protein